MEAAIGFYIWKTVMLFIWHHWWQIILLWTGFDMATKAISKGEEIFTQRIARLWRNRK